MYNLSKSDMTGLLHKVYPYHDTRTSKMFINVWNSEPVARETEGPPRPEHDNITGYTALFGCLRSKVTD